MERNVGDNRRSAERSSADLATRARRGQIGYDGVAYAPATGTYAGVDASSPTFTAVADSGRIMKQAAALINLYPLVMAALYEARFAAEAGPLSTWWN